jgi:UTP--glucose-1-phosphate uridylyltransferase
MLPIVDRPVIQYVVDELVRDGIESMLLITGAGKEAIENHFAAARDGGPEILFVRQPQPLGLGDALRYAAGFAGRDPIAVALGDSIIAPSSAGPGAVRRLADACDRTGACAAVAVTQVPDNEVHRYGIIEGSASANVIDVAGIVEKPDPANVSSRLAVAARYVLGRRVFEALEAIGPDPSGEIQLTAALSAVIADGGRVVAITLAPDEQRYDIGNAEGYSAAFVEHALRDPRFGAPLRARAATLMQRNGSR